MLVNVVLHAPFDESFDILPSLLLKLQLLLLFKLLLLHFFLCFLLRVHLLHHVAHGNCLMDSWFAVLQFEEDVLAYKVKFVDFASLGVLRVLNCNDVAAAEGSIANQVEVVLCLLVEL